jgi:hypothetical protein
MTGYRGDRTATLLSDGTVLITGVVYGAASGGPESTNADVYYPSSDAFSLTGVMTALRQNPTVTLLSDGSVLIAGGAGPRGIVASAELYRPSVLKPPSVLLSLSGDGRGQGAILHADTHQVVSPDHPALSGEALEIYCTGLIDHVVSPRLCRVWKLPNPRISTLSPVRKARTMLSNMADTTASDSFRGVPMAW